jgi:hypothetical protein
MLRIARQSIFKGKEVGALRHASRSTSFSCILVSRDLVLGRAMEAASRWVILTAQADAWES